MKTQRFNEGKVKDRRKRKIEEKMLKEKERERDIANFHNVLLSVPIGLFLF